LEESALENAFSKDEVSSRRVHHAGDTHYHWYQGCGFEEVIDSLAVHTQALFIHKRVGMGDSILECMIIFSFVKLTSVSVIVCANTRDLFFTQGASRTRTPTYVTQCSQEYPNARISIMVKAMVI
jgi:hypothetical protein